MCVVQERELFSMPGTSGRMLMLVPRVCTKTTETYRMPMSSLNIENLRLSSVFAENPWLFKGFPLENWPFSASALSFERRKACRKPRHLVL